MRDTTKNILKKIFLLPFFILFLTAGMAAGDDQDRQERDLLLQRQRQLNSRIVQLKRDRDELLFLKAVSATDSKYLVLKLSPGTGQLRYKNRVLKEFRFQTGTGTRPGQGAVVLTKKREEPKNKRDLAFGTAFVLVPKNSTGSPAGMLRLSLLKKDFQSVFYALEEGARAYILP